MAGRKPKPTHLKVVQGNAGKRPLNKREPKPSGDLAEAPEHFSAEQREVWAYAIAHAPKGLLKRLDLSVLEVWVKSFVLYRQAAAEVATNGQVILTPTGYPVVSPWLANMNKQAALMMKAAAEMGFTPASRSRIVLAEEEVGSDPWAMLAAEG